MRGIGTALGAWRRAGVIAPWQAHVRRFGNVSEKEMEHFSKLSQYWWDPDGSFSMLHDFNPVRANFIRKHVESSEVYRERLGYGIGDLTLPLEGLTALDVGCGGGILAEKLARMGATVHGIDPNREGILIAQNHLSQKSTDISDRVEYKICQVEDLIKEKSFENTNSNTKYDIVVSSEVIEHVPDPLQFIRSLFKCVKPGGTVVLSTFNKTPESYVLGILVAEHLTGLIPKGTHDWSKFIGPLDLIQAAEQMNASHLETHGFIYIPFVRTFFKDPFHRVNYLIAFRA